MRHGWAREGRRIAPRCPARCSRSDSHPCNRSAQDRRPCCARSAPERFRRSPRPPRPARCPAARPRPPTSARSRGSVPCPLENENTAIRAASRPPPECRAARSHDSPAGETAWLPPPVFSLWNQCLLPCPKLSVENLYVDRHNMSDGIHIARDCSIHHSEVDMQKALDIAAVVPAGLVVVGLAV